ncbi:hypothetical protein WICPIJ_002086 [Wickerhamomyces pijperi]|uniref:Uncharacterized protein n=1 Tax=Wickerhamomyces pijperi TaxID=599730 RepID=A0A9P8QC23_WICPI|nr:hypothetical protein WICPIJ_002086 [Wickerhamomyces pijperi]
MLEPLSAGSNKVVDLSKNFSLNLLFIIGVSNTFVVILHGLSAWSLTLMLEVASSKLNPPLRDLTKCSKCACTIGNDDECDYTTQQERTHLLTLARMQRSIEFVFHWNQVSHTLCEVYVRIRVQLTLDSTA